jgi:hypothetical protein
MIREMLLKRRVKRGAALLDAKKPDWYKTIGASFFDGSFDMGSWSSCVCGKLEIISWRDGRNDSIPVIALNGQSLVGYAKAASHGFYSDEPSDLSDYQTLRDLWREQVESRLTVSEARALGMEQAS